MINSIDEPNLLNPNNRACETCNLLSCRDDKVFGGSLPVCKGEWLMDGTDGNPFGLRYNCPKWEDPDEELIDLDVVCMVLDWMDDE